MIRDDALSIEDLGLDFNTFDGVYHVLDRIDLGIRPGDTVGIVGETGCGKSVLAKSVLRLLETPPAVYRSGRIHWNGDNLLECSESKLRKIRGTEISMVFQDPTTFLDPLYTAGDHILESIAHQARVRGQSLSKKEKREIAIELLRQLGLPDPVRAFSSYPHQLSGGMRQRILIAAAMAGHPRLLIADEPTTALDVTVQAQILRLLLRLVESTGVSVMLISHDLGVIAAVCQRIVVMYAGTIVEDAPKQQLLSRPAHPYSQGLIDAVPRLGRGHASFASIPGQIPNLLEPPSGCRFSPRCPRATSLCRESKPLLRPYGDAARVACHYPEAA
jgi:oligopeptide/dipeptide ABC transporter ATP-binding protein